MRSQRSLAVKFLCGSSSSLVRWLLDNNLFYSVHAKHLRHDYIPQATITANLMEKMYLIREGTHYQYPEKVSNFIQAAVRRGFERIRF